MTDLARNARCLRHRHHLLSPDGLGAEESIFSAPSNVKRLRRYTLAEPMYRRCSQRRGRRQFARMNNCAGLAAVRPAV